MGLPRAMGGMGLTRMELIAAPAYHASMTSALQGARKINKQATLCAIVYRDAFDRATASDPLLRRHLETHALQGSDAALSNIDARVHPTSSAPCCAAT